MAKVGEKALSRVVKQLRSAARGEAKARDAAAEAWPDFVDAIAAAQEEIRTGQLAGVDRLIGARQRKRSKDTADAGASDSISAN
jgi:hypothetical protein